MKTVISAIENRLNSVEGIKYIAEDWGQLDYFSPNFPVKFPAVLIDISESNYENVGMDKKETPIHRQTSESTISITVANLRLTNSSKKAPLTQRNNAWSIWDLIEQVHAKLQGFNCTEKTGRLIRTGMNRTKRDDGVQEYTIRYSLSATNV